VLKPSATGSLAAGSGCKVRVKVLRMLRRQRLHNYFSRVFALPLLCQHLNRRVTFEYCVSVAWNRARWWLGGWQHTRWSKCVLPHLHKCLVC
jgi:hypothetical protein